MKSFPAECIAGPFKPDRTSFLIWVIVLPLPEMSNNQGVCVEKLKLPAASCGESNKSSPSPHPFGLSPQVERERRFSNRGKASSAKVEAERKSKQRFEELDQGRLKAESGQAAPKGSRVAWSKELFTPNLLKRYIFKALQPGRSNDRANRFAQKIQQPGTEIRK